MTKLKRELAFIQALTLSLLLAGLLLGHGMNHRDVYPFSSFSLFTHIPKSKTDFDLLIHESAGKVFNPARSLNTLADMFPAAKAATTYHLIQSLGVALYRHDARRADEIQAQLASSIFHQVGRVRYEMIIRHYDVLAMWRDHQFESKSMGWYTVNGTSVAAP